MAYCHRELWLGAYRRYLRCQQYLLLWWVYTSPPMACRSCSSKTMTPLLVSQAMKNSKNPILNPQFGGKKGDLGTGFLIFFSWILQNSPPYLHYSFWAYRRYIYIYFPIMKKILCYKIYDGIKIKFIHISITRRLYFYRYLN